LFHVKMSVTGKDHTKKNSSKLCQSRQWRNCKWETSSLSIFVIITNSSIFGFSSVPPPANSSPRKSSLFGSVRRAKRLSIYKRKKRVSLKQVLIQQKTVQYTRDKRTLQKIALYFFFKFISNQLEYNWVWLKKGFLHNGVLLSHVHTSKGEHLD